MNPLIILETHPIQYHAPVYQFVQEKYKIPVTVIYGSDFSVAGYRDPEFQTSFAWDINLLNGYTVHFLNSSGLANKQRPENLDAHHVYGLLRQLKPAAILLVGYGMRFHRQAFWQAWRSGYPLLFRAETTDHAQQRSRIKEQLRDIALQWYYRHFAGLLYIGQNSLHHYQRLLNNKRPLFFSPYCVDTTPFQPEEDARIRLREQTRRQLGLGETERVLLFAGKLVHKKAPELLIQAVKQMAIEEQQQTTVFFLGSGPLEDDLQRLSAEEPSIKVCILGFQNQHSLSPYYHAADLLVLPSRYGETWGLVINEALHHGLPCIVSDAVGSAPDLIVPNKTGVVFPANSVQGLATAIQQASRLIGDATIRDCCRQQVNHYTTACAAKGIAEAFTYVTNS